MRRDLAISPLQFTPSFLSCEKDLKAILRKLFVESQPYSDDLKRLLVINMKDCLDDKTNPIYVNAIKDMSLAKLREEGLEDYACRAERIKFFPQLETSDANIANIIPMESEIKFILKSIVMFD